MEFGSDESRRFEAERRWAQEDLERDADALDRQRGTLGDVARTLAVSRTTVRVGVAGRVFEGEAIHAGADLLTVAHANHEVDVRLSAASDIRIAERHGGRAPRELSSHPSRFVGRLNEANALEIEIELGGAHLEATPPCRVLVVAQDHVEISTGDGDRRFIPLDAISYIVRRAETHGRRLR